MDNIRITRAAARAAQHHVEPIAQNSSSTEAHHGQRAAEGDDASSGGSITSGMVALGLQPRDDAGTRNASSPASAELRQLRTDNRNLRDELARARHEAALWQHFKNTHYHALGYSSPANMQSAVESSLKASQPAPGKKARPNAR